MFVDTNVLVKARILEAPDHDIARASLQRAFKLPEPLRISRQVLREYLVVVTRPQTWAAPLGRQEAVSDVERLTTIFEVLEDGPVVTDLLLSLCREIPVGGRQISRRQHRRYHAGPRGAQAADVQPGGLSPVRRPNRVGG